MHGHGNTTWSEERVDALKKLWAEGLPASTIAAELGGITRSAVLGKVHRLGLSGRPKSPPPAPRRCRKRQLANARSVAPPITQPLPAAEIEIEPNPAENIAPIGQRCTILDLTDSKCHWPIGDPREADFGFCGGKALDGLPYCGRHARMAYETAQERASRSGGHAGQNRRRWQRWTAEKSEVADLTAVD